LEYFGRFISVWAQQRPSATALHFDNQDYSYAWLEQRIGLTTQWLSQQQIKHGDRVAFIGLNHPMFLVLLFSMARLGAVLVPLNYRLTAYEHSQQLSNASPSLLVADTTFYEHAKSLHDHCVSLDDIEKALDLSTTQTNSSRVSAAPIVGCLDDDLLIVYTSGTTGAPKGAVLTQNALLWNAINSIHAHDLTSEDRVLNVLPMFHVGGLNIMLTPALYVGASVAIEPKFDPGQFLHQVEHWSPTLSLLVPATISAVLSHPRWALTDLSSLRLINTGSSIVPGTLLKALHARGVPAAQVYGATETAPIAVYLRQEDTSRKLGSAGQAAIHTQAKAMRADGTQCNVDEVGEIWVCGPNVMRGYWQMPEATKQVFEGAWFKTGDLACQDAEGYFWVVGRSKDLIISGGENIYPAEIEGLVNEHPAVLECAVVGLPDAHWGEVPVLAIVGREALPRDAAQLIELVHHQLYDKLARYKWPKQIIQVNDLPKTALGKVKKDVLREQLEHTFKQN
jgi:fatty-acyl-CoA synthase